MPERPTPKFEQEPGVETKKEEIPEEDIGAPTSPAVIEKAEPPDAKDEVGDSDLRTPLIMPRDRGDAVEITVPEAENGYTEPTSLAPRDRGDAVEELEEVPEHPASSEPPTAPTESLPDFGADEKDGEPTENEAFLKQEIETINDQDEGERENIVEEFPGNSPTS